MTKQTCNANTTASTEWQPFCHDKRSEKTTKIYFASISRFIGLCNLHELLRVSGVFLVGMENDAELVIRLLDLPGR